MSPWNPFGAPPNPSENAKPPVREEPPVPYAPPADPGPSPEPWPIPPEPPAADERPAGAGPAREPAAYVHPPTFTDDRPMRADGRPRGLPGIRRVLPVPDTILDGADFDGLSVRAASLRGDDHRALNEPRQDFAALWTLPRPGDRPDLLIACVADGVGSEPYSHRGAELACRFFREEAAADAGAILGDEPYEETREGIGRRIVARVARRMDDQAVASAWDPRHLSTTLVGVIAELSPAGRRSRCVLVRVGDSTAYQLHDGTFEELRSGARQNEEITSSATNALPANVGAVTVGTAGIGPGEALVLCTDGLSQPMSSPAVRDHLLDHWSGRPVPSILEFGWQLSFRAKSYGDDRTAVCVWGR